MEVKERWKYYRIQKGKYWKLICVKKAYTLTVAQRKNGIKPAAQSLDIASDITSAERA